MVAVLTHTAAHVVAVLTHTAAHVVAVLVRLTVADLLAITPVRVDVTACERQGHIRTLHAAVE